MMIKINALSLTQLHVLQKEMLVCYNGISCHHCEGEPKILTGLIKPAKFYRYCLFKTNRLKINLGTLH